MDDLTAALAGLTRRVHAYRVFQLQNERSARMTIEIKGLKGKALKGAAVFDRLNRAYDKLIETGDAHAADVESLSPQIEAMQDDITFAVQTLGNSVAGSVTGATEKPVQRPIVETSPSQQAGSATASTEPLTDGAPVLVLKAAE